MSAFGYVRHPSGISTTDRFADELQRSQAQCQVKQTLKIMPVAALRPNLDCKIFQTSHRRTPRFEIKEAEVGVLCSVRTDVLYPETSSYHCLHSHLAYIDWLCESS